MSAVIANAITAGSGTVLTLQDSTRAGDFHAGAIVTVTGPRGVSRMGERVTVKVLASDDEAGWVKVDGVLFSVAACDTIQPFVLPKNGEKHDAGKPRMSLMPMRALWLIVDVLEYGARKYRAHGWRDVPNARERYYDATHRHLARWWSGEHVDKESGLPHLAHAACSVIFLLAAEADK